MPRSTLTAKGQTTVPVEIRRYLGLEPGDQIEFVLGPDGSVRLEPVTRDIPDIERQPQGLRQCAGSRRGDEGRCAQTVSEAMIGLDTNVLCRYLLGDDPAQTRKASKVIDKAAESGTACFVSKVVLCELVWVLESCTTMNRAQIVGTLEALVQTENLEIEERDKVRRAVERFGSGKADFADYVIGESGRIAGCRSTVTFDRALKGSEGFELL